MLGLPKLSFDPVLFLSLWLGGFRDHAGNATVALVNSSHWTQQGGRDSLLGPDNAYLAVTPTFAATSISVFLAIGPSGTPANNYYFDKQAGSRFYFRQSLDTIRTRSGAVSSTLVSPIAKSTSVAFTIESGNKPDFYLSGSHAGQGSAVQSPVIQPGEQWNVLGNGAQGLDSPAFMVAAYPGKLSTAELALLHAYSQSLITPRRQWPGSGLDIPIPMAPNAVADWDLKRIAGATVTDRSGNGYTGTKSADVDSVLTKWGRAARFGGAGNITAPPIPLGTEGTLEALVIPGSVTGTQFLMAGEDGVGAVRRVSLGLNGAAVRFDYYDGADHHSASVTGAAVIGTPIHLIATWNGSTQAIYINGVPQATGSSAIGTNGTAAFTLASRNAGDFFFAGTMISASVSERAISAPEALDRYRKVAGFSTYLDNIQTARVSVADETSGKLSNTGMDIVTGTWRVSEDATGRYFYCVGNGRIKRRVLGADAMVTRLFTEEGSATLTKTTTEIQIDALATDKIRAVQLEAA